MESSQSKPAKLFTIGHSSRSFEEFRLLLKEFDIHSLADVRRYPSSRKFPHFNQDSLSELLLKHEIQYLWFESLGGRRSAQTKRNSPNMGLESPGFRNYADHMMTGEFESAVKELLSLTEMKSTAVMCAERFYWKCHRRLLSDFATSKGVMVFHILETGNLRPHTLTPSAVIKDEGTLTYPSLFAGPG